MYKTVTFLKISPFRGFFIQHYLRLSTLMLVYSLFLPGDLAMDWRYWKAHSGDFMRSSSLSEKKIGTRPGEREPRLSI